MTARGVASLTLRAQRDASDPAASAWVSAHAGSGKTHVLAQRVMRLLLAGAPSSRILCLTFTKAAAANMSARIFDRLARWSLMDDEALTREIVDMGVDPPTMATLDFARRLFARAVETPGGLKIQTIHGFCEKLLHLFPFEANAPAGFRVVEDAERAELLQEAKNKALERAARDSGLLRRALEQVARETSDVGFNKLCDEMVAQRETLAQFSDSAGYADRLRAQLGLRAGESLADVEREIIEGGEPPEQWLPLAATLRRGSTNDQSLASHLELAFSLAPHRDCVDKYLLTYFNAKDEPRGDGKTKIITKGLQKTAPGLLERMERERDRLAPLVDKRKAAAALERSLALARLGDAIISEYTRAKRYRNLLDYDDLIARVWRLFNSSSASWILYKLDSQIDHVLLDEAQDTSAAQWDILTAIVAEFCSGASARPNFRSFFAVGDEKQSIFSFQGAAPEKFDAMRRSFERRFAEAARRFESVRLVQSFRSAPGVLAAVDDIFAVDDHRRGLSFDPQEPAPRHEAWKSDVAALVEIWEPIGSEKSGPSGDWRLPLDFADASNPGERLARKVARKIACLIARESGECVEDQGKTRRVDAGDILILVRRRGSFFEAMIRALKAEQVPVAGADRLELGDHVAVDDLVALGRAALLVEDDLTLATLLKSPLIGLDDDDLIEIAPRREASLYEALKRSLSPRHQDAARKIEEWRVDAAALAPFEFYSRVLGRGGGRARLVARLGSEANDAIDEFLRLALAFEREQAPSLTRFLTMIERLELSIRRDMETSGGAVRVMTAHAAKGLEAKIVFLPDTCGAPAGKHDPKLYALGDGEEITLAWSLGKDSDPPALIRAREDCRDAERNEQRRLLYVALTRAEERLYVAGYHGSKGPAEGCWYNIIRNSLEASCENHPDPLEPGETIWRRGGASPRHDLPSGPADDIVEEVPAFAVTPAPPERVAPPPLRPSSGLAGADAFAPGDSAPLSRQDAERLLTGRLTHALLQRLPECAAPRRFELAMRFLGLRGAGVDAAKRESIARKAIAVIEDPAFAALFGSRSAAEVDLVATLDGGDAVVGRVDRLAETETEVLIADFKTGRPRDAVDPGLARQLALYRAAVTPLYPGKRVRCFLIWTQDASATEVTADILDAALSLATRAGEG